MKRTLLRGSGWLAVSLFCLSVVGCPHRSPLWSPDGSKILLLTGSRGEKVDKAASQLWLVTVESGKATRLEAPEPGVRYLAAAWLDNRSFAVFTGKWEEGYVEAGTERAWRVENGGKEWKKLEVPPPSESRATLRVPVALDGGKRLVYPTGDEKVVVVELETGKTIGEVAPAELIGPGPKGGFLVYRPEAGDTGGMELAAFTSSAGLLWQRRFSQLRDGVAAKLGKKPVEVVFNDTSTSHLPFPADRKAGEQEGGWVGVTFVFTDVAWKEGVSGYYVKLDAKNGAVLDAVHGVGLWGKPVSIGGLVRGLAAPVPKRELPVRIQTIDTESSETTRETPLAGVSKDQVFGYAYDPSGTSFAVSVTADEPVLHLYGDETFEKVRRIVLRP